MTLTQAHPHIQHPPWKLNFQRALHANSSKLTSIILTAVNSSTGKPISKNLKFSGFHSGLHTKANPLAPGSPNTVGKIKLEGLMQFAIDTRGVKDWFGIPKHNDNDKFIDVSCFFGETQRLFRFSGKVFLIVEQGSFDPPHSIPPWSPKDIDWEEERKYLWKLSTQKNQFCSSIDLSYDAESYFSVGGVSNAPTEKNCVSYQSTTNNVVVDENTVPSNFGLLLVDVDYVDEINLEEPTLKTIYQVKVPLRTYGRVSGCEWEEKKEVTV
ncbi:hypothetical protein HDU92_003372 [Lobulomyces angularis]|nr:hypothetical protein HDU92_003372 [Lobulomyces angularis]